MGSSTYGAIHSANENDRAGFGLSLTSYWVAALGQYAKQQGWKAAGLIPGIGNILGMMNTGYDLFNASLQFYKCVKE